MAVHRHHAGGETAERGGVTSAAGEEILHHIASQRVGAKRRPITGSAKQSS